MAKWTRKHLLDLDDVSREEIELIIETARSFKEVSSREVKKVPALRGKTVVLLFFEPSTRTRVSFELAAKRLSADTLSIAANVSSVTKGETVLDTALNIEAMNINAIVVRHQASGVPQILANGTKTPIINAGDGCRAHPTQALLDIMADPLCKVNDDSKISSYEPHLTVKLTLTRKLIAQLRDWFPGALLVGSKLLENVSRDYLVEVAQKLCVKNRMDYINAQFGRYPRRVLPPLR